MTPSLPWVDPDPSGPMPGRPSWNPLPGNTPGEQGGCPSGHVKPFKQPDPWESKGTPHFADTTLWPRAVPSVPYRGERGASSGDTEARPRRQQGRVTQQPCVLGQRLRGW